MRKIAFGWLICSCIAMASSSLHAQPRELRVIDSIGLLRIVKPAAAPLAIEIILSDVGSDAVTEVTLENIDGLAPPVRAALKSPHTYHSPLLGPGTWKVKTKPSDVNLKSVRIVQ